MVGWDFLGAWGSCFSKFPASPRVVVAGGTARGSSLRQRCCSSHSRQTACFTPRRPWLCPCQAVSPCAGGGSSISRVRKEDDGGLYARRALGIPQKAPSSRRAPRGLRPPLPTPVDPRASEQRGLQALELPGPLCHVREAAVGIWAPPRSFNQPPAPTSGLIPPLNPALAARQPRVFQELM